MSFGHFRTLGLRMIAQFLQSRKLASLGRLYAYSDRFRRVFAQSTNMLYIGFDPLRRHTAKKLINRNFPGNSRRIEVKQASEITGYAGKF